MTWYGYHGRLRYPTLWTVGYLGLLVVLIRTNIIQSGTPAKGSAIGVLGSLSDIVKGAVCMFAGVGWGVLALGFVSQTPVGLAIVLVPFGGLLVVGGFFLVRGYIKNLQ